MCMKGFARGNVRPPRKVYFLSFFFPLVFFVLQAMIYYSQICSSSNSCPQPPLHLLSPPQDYFSHTGSASCCFFLTRQTQLLSGFTVSTCLPPSALYKNQLCFNLAVVTYPLENVWLWPNPAVPTTKWPHQGQLQCCCSA